MTKMNMASVIGRVKMKYSPYRESEMCRLRSIMVASTMPITKLARE